MFIRWISLYITIFHILMSIQKSFIDSSPQKIIAAVGTWDFSAIALKPCISMLLDGRNSIDAIEEGIKTIELDTNDQYFVGVGGLPNALGEMELDAAMMDWNTRYGAVMGLKDIKTPISVARTIMEQCIHNVLVGDGALQWALTHGFEKSTDILTESSKMEWLEWKKGIESNIDSHDTIGLICLDKDGHLSAGTSTSGWKFKHPGRVGDAPIIGSGIYCDGDGAAVATGDGEEIMRSCLSFVAVEYMKQGYSPQEACIKGIKRVISLPVAVKADKIKSFRESPDKHMYPALTVSVIAMNRCGDIGAASTLCESNLHRGNPYFPALYWKGIYENSSSNNKSDISLSIIQASLDNTS